MFQTDSAGAILTAPAMDKVTGKGSKAADDTGAFSQEFEKQVNKSSEASAEAEHQASAASKDKQAEGTEPKQQEEAETASSATGEAGTHAAEEHPEAGGKSLPQQVAADADIGKDLQVDAEQAAVAAGEPDDSEKLPLEHQLPVMVEKKDMLAERLLKDNAKEKGDSAPVAVPLTMPAPTADSRTVVGEAVQAEEEPLLAAVRIRDVIAQRMMGGHDQGEHASSGRQGKMDMSTLVSMQIGQGRSSQANFDEALRMGTTSVTGLQQSAPLQAPQPSAASVPVTMTLALPMQQQGWDKAMAERVVWMARGNIQQAQIQLNPRELGPIDIKISMQHDQTHVNFVAHHAATRDAIEAAIPRLRDMMSEQGLNLGQADVSQHSFGDGRQAAAANGGQNPGGSGSAVGDEELVDESMLTQHVSHVSASGVDYFA